MEDNDDCISIRISPECKAALTAAAEAKGMTPSAYLAENMNEIQELYDLFDLS